MLASATWCGTYVENVQVHLTFLAGICNAEKKSFVVLGKCTCSDFALSVLIYES